MSQYMPWFRIFDEIIEDQKMKRVCQEIGSPKYEVIGVWTILLAIANKSPIRGHLLISENLPYTMGEMADIADIKIEKLMRMMEVFEKYHMVEECDGWEITNWGKRQFSGASSTERVQKFRERKKGQADAPLAASVERKTKQKVKTPAVSANGLPAWIPEDLGAACLAFVAASRIEAPEEQNKKWLEGLEMLTEKGAGEEIISAAVERLRKARLTISDPRSIVNTANSLMAAAEEEGLELVDAYGGKVKV